MASRIDSQNPKPGRVKALLDRLKELADADPALRELIEQEAKLEAINEANQLRQQLAAEGVDVIKIASALRKANPR